MLTAQASGIDSLEPTYTCPTATGLTATQSQSPLWTAHLNKSAPLYATLDAISHIPANETTLGFHSSWDHYYDNLSARQCHSKPLPCALATGPNGQLTNTSDCVTQATADAVYRLGNWEYSYLYRDSPLSLAASAASFGVWVAELAEHMRAHLSGASPVRYFHNVAHDGSLARLLSVLQVERMVWPGMGAEVVFEVWGKEGEAGSFLRVLWGGTVLRSSSPALGVLDMVPLEAVLAYFDGLVGVNATLVKGMCGTSSS